MDAAVELGRNPVSKHQIQHEYGDEQADAGQSLPNPSRETKFSGANADREILNFPIQRCIRMWQLCQRPKEKGDSIPFILSRRDYMSRLHDECPQRASITSDKLSSIPIIYIPNPSST